jgi:hypothetical protein
MAALFTARQETATRNFISAGPRDFLLLCALWLLDKHFKI